MDVTAGTLVLWSDIACPWSTLAVIRLHAARDRLGLGDEVRIDHRAFPLELFNSRPTPRHVLDAEIPVVGARAEGFGWTIWRGAPDTYPVTVLPALEAVQAAKEQSLQASEQVDLALRRALFVESRCISIRAEIERALRSCPDVDADAVLARLDEGSPRRAVTRQWRAAQNGPVKGSPHVFLPDGSDEHNPGITLRWAGDHVFPVITGDDPSVYDDLVSRASRRG